MTEYLEEQAKKLAEKAAALERLIKEHRVIFFFEFCIQKYILISRIFFFT